MNKNSASSRKCEPQKFVGLDVHKETIAIAVADRGTSALARLVSSVTTSTSCARPFGGSARRRS